MTPEECVYSFVTDQEKQEIIIEYYPRIAAEWDLTPDLAVRYAIAAWLTLCETGEYPGITSGYRSPKRQLELINRWDAGNRTGLVAKPAQRSWHMQGMAIDVVRYRTNRTRPISILSRMSFDKFRQYMEQFGVTWGGRFTPADPVHFQYPTGELLSASQLIYRGQTA